MSFVDTASSIREIAGRRVRVYESGEGPPVIVLHGWGGKIESMAPILQCLQGFRTIAIDLPGFGESPQPDEVWGTPEYAGFVRDLMDAMNVERATFVGHSYGAKTSLYLAATTPDAVEKLVLVSSSGLRTPPSLQARVKRGLSKTAKVAGRLGEPGQKLRGAIHKRIASKDYQDAGPLRPILVRVVNEDLKGLLPKVRASTLLVWGSEDDSVPMSHARTMEANIPDAGLVVFEGAGHFPYLDDSPRFCRVLQSFLGASGA
jgi:pimeloyl-ACP methyl ester carboxylesterase